jgi:hypothetical protein
VYTCAFWFGDITIQGREKKPCCLSKLRSYTMHLRGPLHWCFMGTPSVCTLTVCLYPYLLPVPLPVPLSVPLPVPLSVPLHVPLPVPLPVSLSVPLPVKVICLPM